MAENLPIKHSLSEAIHNSSISKIDIQSQHPTYPLEDIDQERLFEITSPKTDQSQNRPVPKQTRSVPDHTSTTLDRITSISDQSKIRSLPNLTCPTLFRTRAVPDPKNVKSLFRLVWVRRLGQHSIDVHQVGLPRTNDRLMVRHILLLINGSL